MKKLAWPMVLVAALMAGSVLAGVSIPYTNDFESYLQGYSLTNLAAEGWSASDGTVAVQTNVVWTQNVSPNLKAVTIPGETALTNAVTVAPGLSNIWLDCEVRVVTDRAETAPTPDSNAVALAYVNADGWLTVYDRDAGGWTLLSNTVAGAGVPVLTNGQWARITVHQNYVSKRCAVFLNGQALREGLPFISNVTQCASFRLTGAADDPSYFDNYAFTTHTGFSAPLTNDINADGVADVQEVQQFGRLARRLEVGPGLAFTTVTGALAAAQARDILVISGPGPYAGDAVIGLALGFVTGQVFTINGTLALGAGLVLTSQVGFACNTLIVSNAGTLAVGGNVTATDLQIRSGARLVVSNGTLTANGLVLTGSFTLDENWGAAQARVGLPFEDDFESYAAGVSLNSLGFRGWGASDGAVAVQSNLTYGGSGRAVALEFGQMLSNRVLTASPATVWTDLRVVGRYDSNDIPSEVDSNTLANVFVNSNGYLAVYNNNAWVVCSNDVWGGTVAAMTNGQWVRISVQNHFGRQDSAVFLDGRLLRQRVPFIRTTNRDRYSGFWLNNTETDAVAADEVAISYGVPVTLTNNCDGDEMTDADEIQRYGSVLVFPPTGSVFRLR
jgi:hypothetical protein